MFHYDITRFAHNETLRDMTEVNRHITYLLDEFGVTVLYDKENRVYVKKYIGSTITPVCIIFVFLTENRVFCESGTSLR